MIELTAHLRGPEGCPWDRAQDYDTLKGLLLEEAYEVVDAANARDFDGLEDELGDLLFLVVFYSRIAEEEGRFTIDDVVEHVHAKLIRRHPHVFGEVRAGNAGEALQSWMAVKEQERAAAGKRAKNSVLDGILPSLPSTLVAHELGTRAAEVGFEWAKVGDLLEKIEEEVHELRQELAAATAQSRPARVEEEVGDLLFAVANLSRFLHFDAESCLRRANQKFQRRFQAMEQEILKRGKQLKECSLDEMEAVWEKLKLRASAQAEVRVGIKSSERLHVKRLRLAPDDPDMKIERIELREIQMPLVHFFETSFGRTTTRRIVLVRVDADGADRLGRSDRRRSAVLQLRNARDGLAHPARFPDSLDARQGLGGPGRRRAALPPDSRAQHGQGGAGKCALGHCRATAEPAVGEVGGRDAARKFPAAFRSAFRTPSRSCWKRSSAKWRPGYQRIKVKVKPGWDVNVLEAIRNRFPRILLMADANSAYSLADVAHLKEFDRFYLMMIEQPLGWDDLLDHAKLAEARSQRPSAWMNPFTTPTTRAKPSKSARARSSTSSWGAWADSRAARQVHDVCRARNVPVWCGGMLESGIGRAHNIAMSTLPGFTLPGDVSASQRYWARRHHRPGSHGERAGHHSRSADARAWGTRPICTRIEKLTVRKESFE